MPMSTVESPRRQRLPKLTINIPNILTVLRILVTPLFVIFLIRNQHGYALLVFAFAGVSDGLDGLIARWLNQRSDLGAVLDPIADKLLLTAAYITLGILKDIPGWLAVLVISRDVLIVTGIAVLTFANIPFDIRPSLVSKCTTVFQILMIGVSLLDLDFSGAQTLQLALGWMTAGMTVLSGLHYTYLGLNILQTGYGAQTKKDAD
jgi:cardiolipin synthase (CMP-forming)